MDADEKFSRATDGPSERVRQADERSGGTAKRREDRPNRGISQPALAHYSRKHLPRITMNAYVSNNKASC
ncbi:hypothetical protein [Erwinia sp. S38]|uniref:hypothetical protein n=1 Tax=Erwinia sp. S38 TaxID=2769338 RepID=UPI00190DB877|nr:hypothetical protein [Erwinia sp. S38]MBK0001023.1 hypothetical protein [Erwinia sp. S38]